MRIAVFRVSYRVDRTRQHVKAAEGYLDLGMLAEASAELEEIDPGQKLCREVLAVRARIYEAAGAWESMCVVSGHLAREWPDEAQHWMWLAYATRRTKSVDDATVVMLKAMVRHPKCALIYYNLACYASVNGTIPEARRLLDTAIGLEPGLRGPALDDPDLGAVWKAMG